MDFYETQKLGTVNKHQPTRHRGKRLTEDQVSLLEKSFSSDKKLDPERKLRLAVELGVPPRQVAIWYQNKRARWKTQSMEFEYNTLQVKLESAIAEKRELEKDVERLREELKKARDMMALAGLSHHHAKEPNSNCNNNIIISCCSNNVISGSCEEGGGSSASNNSLNEDDRHMTCCWEDEENRTLHLDDLYACVRFAGGSARSDN